jgi:hypothetical protein
VEMVDAEIDIAEDIVRVVAKQVVVNGKTEELQVLYDLKIRR